jgi:hypothetical protein
VSKPNANAEKVRAHRARLRAQGLRPVQMWLPDTRSEAFRAEISRQMKNLVASDQEKDDQAFIDSLFDWNDF